MIICVMGAGFLSRIRGVSLGRALCAMGARLCIGRVMRRICRRGVGVFVLRAGVFRVYRLGVCADVC